LPFLFCCIAILAGCAQVGGPRTEAPDAAAADQAYLQGDFEGAAQDFLQLADAHPRDGAFYRLRAAEAYLQSGQIPAMAAVLPDIKRSRLQGDETIRFDLLAAEAALANHDAAAALAHLDFAAAAVAMPLRLRALELRARAQAMQGDALDSARTRADLDHLLSGDDRAQNQAQIVATLSTMPVDALRNEATVLAPDDPLRGWIDQALRAGGSALPVVVLHPDRPVGTLIPRGSQPAEREGYHPVSRIALLLPSAGALAAVAQPVRDGFFAAHFADGDAQRAPITVYDTGTSPTEAVAAYQQAVSDGADRIVGPLAREDVTAVFAQGNLPVPVLALNLPDGVPTPPGSAAFALSPDAEAAQAAEYMLKQGITQAVAIVTTEDWGERAALAFRAQFEAGNGQMLGEGRIEPGQVDYSAMIHQALATVPVSSTAPAVPGAAPVPPVPPAGIGIFISLRPQQARLLMPQLKLAGHTGVPVFATSHIYAGSYSPGLDRDLDGVWFCDAPWLFDTALGLPKHDDIVRSLDSARGAGGRLFAMGMDAYHLLPYLDWLVQHPDSYLPGATGQLAEDHLGRVQRLLTWAQFRNGAARPVGGGLQSGTPDP
jgi:outer membrane PBP1 activator LpoA protein